MKGWCDQELETKEWKQGTKIFCEATGHGQVSYPNRGIGKHIGRFCGCCGKMREEEIKRECPLPWGLHIDWSDPEQVAWLSKIYRGSRGSMNE